MLAGRGLLGRQTQPPPFLARSLRSPDASPGMRMGSLVRMFVFGDLLGQFDPVGCLSSNGDSMPGEPMDRPMIHFYDVAHRRVLCGWHMQANSTKRARFVTCPACLRLLAAGSANRLEEEDRSSSDRSS